MRFVRDDLQHPQVLALLEEHLRSSRSHSPPESVHALDVESLRGPGIAFWTAWDGEDLLGCGALKRLDAQHVELKSMRTAYAHQRKGVARAILTHLLAEAQANGFARMSLETGTPDAFAAARALYRDVGFEECDPFEGYVLDPYSVFMTRQLQ
ncbi:GNAT family N-acetyltransferase [Rhodoferax saidenbachensis]|uniref:GNAT family N-acetyltransferase n=1 Tax=Rhodoferax saidenbachensis TaxID=1484693 RepID=A0A1P8K787_9BURK|nr:GNAT family N-acetyltransferase [Rhodoferax saidenbachensis]APW41880.1 GNAT family N-acetyltransferase [Rhodoferax saidenbachensis]